MHFPGNGWPEWSDNAVTLTDAELDEVDDVTEDGLIISSQSLPSSYFTNERFVWEIDECYLNASRKRGLCCFRKDMFDQFFLRGVHVGVTSNKTGMDALRAACFNLSFPTVKILLDAKADVDASHPTTGTTPLILAVKAVGEGDGQRNQVQIVRALMQSGASFLKEERGGRCALHYAAMSGKANALKVMLRESGFNIWDLNGCREDWMNEFTPKSLVHNILLIAAINLRVAKPMLKYLMSLPPDPWTGHTLLMAAAELIDDSLIRTLIMLGVDTTVRDHYGSTALDILNTAVLLSSYNVDRRWQARVTNCRYYLKLKKRKA